MSTWASFMVRGIIKNHPRWRESMDVTILLGSSSDLPIAQKCTKILLDDANRSDFMHKLLSKTYTSIKSLMECPQDV